MSLNFLHICLSEGWGGLEMAVTRWNQVLKDNGHKNLNICTPDSPLSHDLKKNNFKTLEWESAHYFSPGFTYQLRKLVQQKKVDVVLLQNLRDLWIVSPALWKQDKIQLVGFTQMLVGVKKKDFLHQLIYCRLDHVCTLTDWQKKALMPYLPIKESKYKTIPNFVDVSRFKPSLRSLSVRSQMGYKEDDFLIGVMGRIDQQKGQKELLEAFSNLCRSRENLKLLIVGEPTRGESSQEKYFQKLKELVAQKKIEKQVSFISFQKEPQQLIANLDLFVMPSYRETFGFVLVEAMASGVPVLSTRAGGVPEILGQGELGFLALPKDSQDLKSQLEIILDQTQLRKEKAEKALRHIHEFYERQKVYERFMKIILKK